MTTALGWNIPSRVLDAGPVALIVLEGALALAVAHRRPGQSAALLVAGLAISAGALLLRHRAPLAVLAVVLAVSLGLGYGPVVLLPVLLAAFTVAEYTDRSKLIVAAIVAGAGVAATEAVHGPAIKVTTLFSRLLPLGLAMAVGLYLRARADYITGLRERAERLERERELLAAQAVADERVRIARELHDVVAHNVSLMVVQAQAVAAAGGASVDSPHHAMLARIADLGREAMSEMHRMLGLLRVSDDGMPERAPQPGVSDLERLIASTRQTGLDARLQVVGQRHELPPGVDLSAYRIVQEALTNVIRHAGARRADVTVSYRPDWIELTVSDDGHGDVGANGRSGGHGLVGMRERVALFGGELAAGGCPDGRGYRVKACLPLAGT